MTDHPLTETAAAELWDNVPESVHVHDFDEADRDIQDHTTAALRAAFDAGREHEHTQARPTKITDEMRRAAASAYEDMAQVTRPENHEKCLNAALEAVLAVATPTDPRVHSIENANLDDVLPGDHLTRAYSREEGSVIVKGTREGIAHHQDGDGNWLTEDGVLLAGRWDRNTTLTIRRPVQEFPGKLDTVIVPNDGREAIGAVFSGVVYHAREAVLVSSGLWQGAWRSAEGVKYFMTSRDLLTGTWKEDDQ